MSVLIFKELPRAVFLQHLVLSEALLSEDDLSLLNASPVGLQSTKTKVGEHHEHTCPNNRNH